MIHARRFALLLVVASASPALADDAPVTHTDQLVVVTPNAPVVITNGQVAPQGPGTVAPAQPAPAAPTGAPMTHAWSDVSHINGTLVPVGEQNKYVYAFKRTNISTNPIGWIAGVYGLSVSHAVTNNIALKVDGNIFSDLWGSSGYEVSASVPIYLKRAYSGPFIEPGVMARGLESTDYVYDCYDCATTMSTRVSAGPMVLVGWHTTFDSGFNIAAAAGGMRNVNADDSYDEYGTDERVEFVGYFRVGYAF